MKVSENKGILPVFLERSDCRFGCEVKEQRPLVSFAGRRSPTFEILHTALCSRRSTVRTSGMVKPVKRGLQPEPLNNRKRGGRTLTPPLEFLSCSPYFSSTLQDQTSSQQQDQTTTQNKDYRELISLSMHYGGLSRLPCSWLTLEDTCLSRQPSQSSR